MLHKTAIKDLLTGAEFNDYVVLDRNKLGFETEDTKFDYQTQVCKKHAQQYKMADGLIEYVGMDTCGVVGCDEPAEYSYLFMVEGTPGSTKRHHSAKGKRKATRTKRATGTRVMTPEIPATIQRYK